MKKLLFAVVLLAGTGWAANNITLSGAGAGSVTINGPAGVNLLPSTSTWTAPQIYNNATTSPAIKINQTGNTGTGYGTGGSFVIDATNTTGYGMQIYTHREHGTQLTGLMTLTSDTTSYDEPMLYIHDLSSGTVGANAEIRIDSNNPDIEFTETDQVSPAGKFELAIQSDLMQFNSRNTANTAFQLRLGMAHSGSLNFYSQDDNRNYVGFIAPAVLSVTTQYTLPLNDGSNGQFLKTNGSGTLSFATPAGGGDALLAGTQNWTGVNTSNSTNAGGAIKVNQSATTTDSPTVGAIAVDNTGSNGIGLAVYSNQGASQVDPMVLITQNNTAYSAYVVEIVAKATGYPATTLELQAPIPSIEFRGNQTSPPLNEYQISEKVDQLRLEGRLADNTGFDSIMLLQRPTTGSNTSGMVYIGNGYNFPINTLDVGGDTTGSSAVGTSSATVVIGRTYAGSVKAPPDSLLVEGVVGAGSKTLAQINADVPVKAGQMVYCSNCSVYAICVSTGTGKGAYVGASSRSTPCN